MPKHSGECLLGVIMRRYENRSTIMTSNRPLEEWGKLICDVPTAGAVLDRFLHHARVIAITGKSYRVKEAPVTGLKTKSSGSPTNLRPQNRRAERLAFRFCSFYLATYESSVPRLWLPHDQR